MKYLKLYEAFLSNTLSRLYGYLKGKNVSAYSLEQFRGDLVKAAAAFEIPLDKIPEEGVSYLSRKRAILLRNKEEAGNKKGIWAVKFWFDKDGRYIGASGTGNAQYSAAIDQTTHCQPLDEGQWKHIRSSKDFPKTGYLRPIQEDEYEGLKNGEPVIATLVTERDYSSERIDRLVYGNIYIDENDNIFVVHENGYADGMSPELMPTEAYPDMDWKSYTWSIFARGAIGNDHFNLHRVIESESPLQLESDKKYGEDVNPFDFNLPFDAEMNLHPWKAAQRADIEKEADFAVILYIDDILNKGLKSTKETSDEREESRKGATALMSDEDFKEANLKKYMESIIKKIGVTPESVELKNLEKIVSGIMSSGISESYAFLSILNRDFREIDNFSYQIKRMISATSVVEVPKKAEYIKMAYISFKQSYSILKRRMSEGFKDKKAIMDVLKEFNELKPLYDAILRIGGKISKALAAKEIVRGEDLTKIYFKIKSISDLMESDDFHLSYYIDGIVDSIKYASHDKDRFRRRINDMDSESYTERKGDNKSSLMEMDLKKLADIESYVDEIFGK